MGGLSSLVNRLHLVKQIPIFEKLNWFELQKIARKSIIAEYKKGDFITSVSVGSLFGIGLVRGTAKMKTMLAILIAWVTTLPIAATLAMAIYWLVK